MKRRTLFAAAASLAVVPGLPLQAQVIDLNDAINKAGRQRMLSQRMGKAYIAIVENVEAPLAQQVLDRSMALFDRQLTELKAYASNADLKQTYSALEAAWSQFKTVLIGTAPSKAGVPAVLAHAGKVLALAHQGTQQYEALLSKPVAKLVNVAGRQRMLSQRMAKFYLALAIQVEPAVARAEIAKARTEFTAALELLRNAPEATAKIKDELQLGEAQWLLFDAALQKAPAPGASKPLSDVFVTSENLLVVMDRITGLYSALKV
jgi:nitrate/nitrite-specific signal transduction histidine kinase